MANQLSFWLATFTVVIKIKVTFSVHDQPNFMHMLFYQDFLCLYVATVFLERKSSYRLS